MDTLRKYSGDIQFIFMRVNAHIVSVSITRLSCFVHLPTNDKIKIFNDLGISTDRDYVSISHETSKSLVGLLTTLGIRFTQSIGNPPHGTTNTVSQC